MSKPVKVRSAPGLVWVKQRREGVYQARWQCRTDLAKKGFQIKSVKLWTGTGDPTLEEWDWIADRCNELQQEMLVWANGGIPAGKIYDGTLLSLIKAYKLDAESPYKRVRYSSRMHYDSLMESIAKEHGDELI